MSKRNGKPRHNNRMIRSTKDIISLAREIEPRFLTICELHGRKSGGEELPIPKDIHIHFIVWREVLVRHRRGDYRNSLSEYESLKVVAQWTVSENCKLRGQPDKMIPWPD